MKFYKYFCNTTKHTHVHLLCTRKILVTPKLWTSHLETEFILVCDTWDGGIFKNTNEEEKIE